MFLSRNMRSMSEVKLWLCKFCLDFTLIIDVFGLVTIIVVIQLVSSDLEIYIDEYFFTIPDVSESFADAVNTCKTKNNSTLAVVNDSFTQLALARLLKSSSILTSVMYINIKLDQRTDNGSKTWFRVNGPKYEGNFLQLSHLKNHSIQN